MKVIILKGLQGSGKSTYARKWVSEDPEHRVRINRDDIRKMLGPYWIPTREDLVSSIEYDTLQAAIAEDYDIIIDNMNLNPNTVSNLKKSINELDNKYQIEEVFMNTPLEECILIDSMRLEPVGEKVIRETYAKYKEMIDNHE